MTTLLNQDSDPVELTVSAVIRDIVGDKKQFTLSDNLVTDLHIASDDLSFIFVPQLEKKLNVKVPVKEWLNVNTGLEACALLRRYIASK